MSGNAVLSAVATFFLYALTALCLQNAVFSRALGMSRLISLVDDTTDTIVFGILLTIVTVSSGIMFYCINKFWLADFEYAEYVRVLVMIACMGISFLLVFLAVVKLAPYAFVTKAAEALPVATFNCLVLGCLLITTNYKYSFFNTIAYNIGASAGFVLAVLLVTEGQRKLQNRDMPVAFKGLPSTLLFIAGLVLAVYGLSGYTFSS
ncbi:MAG: Rnf-Nqr domain containing protein [Oscillospiraceae bacterium]